jgi:MFS superfamily sulfate permease-like transporter
MRLPVFAWLPTYDRSGIRNDLLAGLTVWAVLVPEALAYATIAGVSPVVGLYAAPGALILYAALGSSRHLVTGPMAATAALSAAAVGDLAAGGSDAFLQLTITLGLVVGILALVAGGRGRRRAARLPDDRGRGRGPNRPLARAAS